MARKKVVFDTQEYPGSISVGEPTYPRFDKLVEIQAGRGEVAVTAKFFFSARTNPKICAALDALAKAMLEEGGEEVGVVLIG